MLILEDTRQQERKHEKKHEYFRSVGVHWNRTALYCGDYTLPANQSVCIDTKKNIDEIINDIHVKKMAKRDIYEKVFSLFEEYHLDFDFADEIYHAVCDDDTERFAEKEINDICFGYHVTERAIAEFQTLYIKRHGFFHRGLKRAQNSGIKLIVLIENEDGVKSIDDLFHWDNQRLHRYNKIAYMHNHGRWLSIPLPKAKPTSGQTLAKAMLTMEKKYGVEFQFCTPEEAGRRIIELLEGDYGRQENVQQKNDKQ